MYLYRYHIVYVYRYKKVESVDIILSEYVHGIFWILEEKTILSSPASLARSCSFPMLAGFESIIIQNYQSI